MLLYMYMYFDCQRPPSSKGLRQEILLFLVNSELKSVLSAFTHRQNALIKLRGRHQMNSGCQGELMIICFGG